MSEVLRVGLLEQEEVDLGGQTKVKPEQKLWVKAVTVFQIVEVLDAPTRQGGRDRSTRVRGISSYLITTSGTPLLTSQIIQQLTIVTTRWLRAMITKLITNIKLFLTFLIRITSQLF